MQGQGRKSTSVDVYIGGRIRARRKALGVSQEQLARSLGIAFQQVQKYEHGANRVSASKLYDVAKILDVPISFFFDGLAVVDHLAPDPARHRRPGPHPGHRPQAPQAVHGGGQPGPGGA